MDRIISQYLRTHRRLVIPQLGAFIRRQDDGAVVFSELMRRDDGVLRSLLTGQRGVSDLEAAGAIDRFVFEVRLALQQGSGYPIPGLGKFVAEETGRIVFRCDPDFASAVPGRLPEGPGAPNVPERGAERKRDDASVARTPDKQDGAVGDFRVSASPAYRPEPYVKGLRYGKPIRTADAYTYANSRPSRRVDKFLLLAVAAALVALAAILYGYLRERTVREQERQYLEHLVPSGEDAAVLPPENDATFPPGE